MSVTSALCRFLAVVMAVVLSAFVSSTAADKGGNASSQSAEGYAAEATGGLGKRVVVVSNRKGQRHWFAARRAGRQQGHQVYSLRND